jgi:hypothetical protein
MAPQVADSSFKPSPAALFIPAAEAQPHGRLSPIFRSFERVIPTVWIAGSNDSSNDSSLDMPGPE